MKERVFSKWLMPMAMCLVAMLGGCRTTGDAAAALSKREFGIGILSVNLLDVYSLPYSPTGTDWRARYARIGAWIQATGNHPDIIALQEAPGRWECGFAPTLQDYAGLDFLIDEVRKATGEQYRIAYLIVGRPGGTQPTGWIAGRSAGGCLQQGGRALLYRSSRVRNVVTGPQQGITVATPFTPYPLYTPFMARSLQCCPTVAGSGNVCQLIDGAPSPFAGSSGQNTCSTPMGVAWTRARRSMEGADPGKPQLESVFSRFELRNQPGNYFHVYNVHRGFTKDPLDDVFGSQAPGVVSIERLVTAMEDKFRAPANVNLYPPIVVGDLNFGANNLPPPPREVLDNFVRFEMAMWGPENVGALFGLPSAFPAKRQAHANLQTVMPATQPGEACYRDAATLWSDHCGIFFRVEPAP
jgi:hypothetical protein